MNSRLVRAACLSWALAACLSWAASAQPVAIDVPVNRPARLHAVIDSFATLSGPGRAAAWPIVRLTGSGALRTDSIRFLPGLVIDCGATGFSRPHLVLEAGSPGPLLYYPDELRAGGGGAGVPYLHHAVLRNCTVSGNGANVHPLVYVYNGGFQMRIENSHLKNSLGPCLFVERTALNVSVVDTDFSHCVRGAIDSRLDMLAGVLAVVRGQIDNSGDSTHATIRIRQERRSAWQGAPGLVSLRDLKFEYPTRLPRAVVEVSATETGLGVIYDGFSVAVAHKDWGRDWTVALPALILDSSAGSGVVHHDIRSVRSSGAVSFGFVSRGVGRFPPDALRTIVIGSCYIVAGPL